MLLRKNMIFTSEYHFSWVLDIIEWILYDSIYVMKNT